MVGSSGSGKSLLAKSLIRLEKPAMIITGSIVLQGVDLVKASPRELRGLRGGVIGYVPQNPLSALDPVYSIGFQFKEVLARHLSRILPESRSNGADKNALWNNILKWMKRIDISDPEPRLRQYPHQWSRGMLQRAILSMSYSITPQVIILDEVTSALDPTITMQIIALLKDLRARNNTSIIMITHDLAIANEICDSIAVLSEGRIVEKGPADEVLNRPQHPFTKRLAAGLVI